MTLIEKIKIIYPELNSEDFYPHNNVILIQNDSNGLGDYIREWNHPTLPRPTEEQLDAIN